MNLMGINHSFTSSSYSRVLLLALLFPITIQAIETDDKLQISGFCQEPDTVHASVDNSETVHLLQNNHDLKAINERGTLRVLLQRKTNACTISQTERQLLEQFSGFKGSGFTLDLCRK